ncbi:calmodulin-binding transcription activator 3-like isoform X2 [Magnolia sinica]|uniref:calmodulin-binding transcription activator 3-like isoform X2 n=1 Tax=Magnolia sinica TaxID=86752 RepID=UPI00265A8861|nr:calmodulin-binding transcription activator 3-like isoform X2 [Magnolia sinica]
MAEVRRYGLSAQLDIEQILTEAQNRWLRPPEICEILRNYRKFHIAPEPPNKPPSGSLFLFDRKVLRYFRKDGHNWRKKKDGKTVKEAHERLKAGSVDVLHCYYAHGEENENFQRRSYWMLEEDLMHIVLVHYREVKGSKASFARNRDPDEILQSSQTSSPVSSYFLPNHNQVPSHTTDTSSLNSAQNSEYDDTESDNQQASSRFRSFLEPHQSEDKPVMNQMDTGLLETYFPSSNPSNQSDYLVKQSNIPGLGDSGFGLTFNELRKPIDAAPWEEVLEHCTTGFQSAPFRPTISSTQTANMLGMPKQENGLLGQLFMDEFSMKQEFMTNPQGQAKWQIAAEDDSSNMSAWSTDHKLHMDSAFELRSGSQEHKGHYVDAHRDPEAFSTDSDQENGSPVPDGFQVHLSNAEAGYVLTSNFDAEYDPSTKQQDSSRTEGEGGLKKFDSFSRWMSKELGEVADANVQSSSAVYWDTIESGNVVEDSSMSPQEQLDSYMLSPSLSHDQLFSILDFSPNWTYTGSETKVLITGTFLKDKNDAQNCKWSCMFGQVEVPAEVLADGVLRCHAPLHAAGRVPFYVTCSNRLACSEVREFEYRVSHTQDTDIPDASTENTSEILLRIRLGRLLSLESVEHPRFSGSVCEKPHISSKINSLLEEDDDEWFQMVKLTTDVDFSPDTVKEQLLQKVLKEKLRAWLLYKVAEGGKGPSVLDKDGQGVLHLAAALGYDWAIAPTLAAGVKIDFRDVHGWTALHWAAYCGRESTVVALVSLGGAPGALTDPTPKFPSGRTPWDLASINGHKGIAGYLAETSLTSQLLDLTLKESSRDGTAPEASGVKAVQAIAERSATQFSDGDLQDGLSLKDSLTAVRNAAQAAARIHEVFRVHSFHRKQLIEYGDENFGMSDERALSLISVKTHRTGQHDEPSHTAAIRIQNKFRSWKGRKEFLIIRQRIVKIQAHVRGHQVRKHYGKIIWTVGIVEKAILRWRRKGSGLRGFRVEAPSIQTGSSNDDDYDFLKEGRKQTEARLEKALARVKSMAQNPEARDQYRRLRTAEFQDIKVAYDRVLNEKGEAVEDGDEDLLALEALLGDDDTCMTTAS